MKTELSKYLIQESMNHELPVALGRVILDISYVADIINHRVSHLGIFDDDTYTGDINTHGDEVLALDEIADRTFTQVLSFNGDCCLIGSEEQEDMYEVPMSEDAPYVVMIDPLDGSSNFEVNGSMGTIFSVYNKYTGNISADEGLFDGRSQVAAGYILYGPSTKLVYSRGKGVHEFTYDVEENKFILTKENILIADPGNLYSVNMGNYYLFSKGVKSYINYCNQYVVSRNKERYSLRYSGALVADFHTCLVRGGIFMYPGTQKYENGKLRLNYECRPMAFLVEQAGGRAYAGDMDLLDVQAESLHQRTPLFIGVKKAVDEVQEFIACLDKVGEKIEKAS